MVTDNTQRGLDQLHRLHRAAGAAGHRRLAVIAGEPSWSLEVAGAFLRACRAGPQLWIGDSGAHPAPVTDYRHAADRLGTDLGVLVYDAWSGFDPDAFGAATGTVHGGGLILLLTPPPDRWPAYPDPAAARIAIAGHDYASLSGRLIARLTRVLQRDPDAWLWSQDQLPPTVILPDSEPARPQRPGDRACLSGDQAAAVAAVTAAAREPATATLVLTADRGRGKSAALGIAAGRLLRQDGADVVVTAPRSRAADNVFRHARAHCPGADTDRLALRYGPALMEYTAPDALVQSPTPAQVLLVDEAAGIPAPLLEALLQHYPRVVFATTVHGYEGTGRGFALRFMGALDRRRPGWRNLALQTPVRWAARDPVERLVSSALLLDADPAPEAAVAGLDPSLTAYQRLDRDRLIGEEDRLRQVFGLLVNAHYRTTPTDLRNLLDGPTTAVHVLCRGSAVAAAALTVDEGPFDEALTAAIWLGIKRPHGHLLPQSLAFHGGLLGIAALRCRRIMRIAVHPAARRRGLGRRLIEAVIEQAAGEGVDTLGASFGAAPDLLAFWRCVGCETVRLGHRREASSGLHAAMVARGLSAAGRRGIEGAKARLRADLPTLLAGPLHDLEPDLRNALPAAAVERAGATEHDYLLAFGFALAHRPLGPTLPALARILRWAPETGPAEDRALLDAAVHRLQPPPELAHQFDLPSQKAAVARLRAAVKHRLAGIDDPCCDAASRAFRTLQCRAGAAERRRDYGRDGYGRVTTVGGAYAATGPGS